MKFKFLLLLLLSFSVYAGDASVGKIVAGRGDFYINEAGQDIGSEVSTNDIITTSANSFVIVQFEDGTKLTVRPNSKIIISRYVYNESAEDGVNLSVMEGGLRILTGAIAKNNPDNFKVQTPVALMGVRGTEFSLLLCGEQICEVGAK